MQVLKYLAELRVSTEFSTFSTYLNALCMFKHRIQQAVEIEQAFISQAAPQAEFGETQAFETYQSSLFHRLIFQH